MPLIGPNAPCPCGSGIKYKKCCRPYHRGKLAPDALTLMKSRYSAYAAGEVEYLIATTHPDHPEMQKDRQKWKKEILDFCRMERFEGLEILEWEPGEEEAFVTFIAHLGSGSMRERSRFLRRENRWLYHSGHFPDS